MTSDASDVIDWTEAMEQCGDDEDFLRELLDDLRGEVAAQIQKIEITLKGPNSADYYQHIQRASHVIKGAAANLMCHPLRRAAANLEKSAAKAYSVQDKITDEVKQEVLQLFVEFCDAARAYNDFLDTIDV